MLKLGFVVPYEGVPVARLPPATGRTTETMKNTKTLDRARANDAARLQALEWAANTHGCPLNDGPRPAPHGASWIARGRNKLYSDRELVTFRGPTFAGVSATAAAHGLDRPTVFLCCDRCGRWLCVVDPRNAAAIAATHHASERCLYRSVVAGLLWQGWAPVASHAKRLPTEQLEALGAWEGPGNNRDSRRAWAPLPRVLALIALRFAALEAGTTIPPEGYEIVQGLAEDWITTARAWVADLTAEGDHLHNATALYDELAARIVGATNVARLDQAP